jgi:hypothetical protein
MPLYDMTNLGHAPFWQDSDTFNRFLDPFLGEVPI